MPLPDLPQLGRTLLAYTVWADREQLASLERLPPEHLVVATGSSFGTVLGTIAHILGSEQVWLARFVGAPIERPSETDWSDLAAVRAGFEELWPNLEFFIAGLDGAQLESEVAWIGRGGDPYRQPLWQCIVHMSHHSGYHRGQLTTMQRQLGHVSVPATDLIKYFATR